MMCPHGQEGLSQGGHFSDKGGGGQFFEIFVRTSFMDGPYSISLNTVGCTVVYTSTRD